MTEFLAQHWEFLSMIVPLLLKPLNDRTRHWSQHGNIALRILAAILELLCFVQLRKPDLKKKEPIALSGEMGR